MSTSISKTLWGRGLNGLDVDLYTLQSDEGLTVKISTFGGIITEILAPDHDGKLENVVLGFDSIGPYKEKHPYFGAIVGRYANRIANGTFTIDEKEYTLARNNGGNALHGGLEGFDKKNWDASIIETENGAALQLEYISKHLEEGYPGELTVTVIYQLVGSDLHINYYAQTDQPTHLNLTNHSYFNLAGQGTVMDHHLWLNATRYTPFNEHSIPKGEILMVEGTPLDFTKEKPIGRDFDDQPGGYDHNFVIDHKNHEMCLAAVLTEPGSGRTLEVFTTEPGIQLYTSNFLDGSLSRGEFTFEKHSGVCLETQHFPDSPNKPLFPTTLLKPEEKFESSTIFRFGTKK